MVKLFAGGFPRDLDEQELKDIFSQYGLVEAVNIVRDKHTGISRRFGFVDMADVEGARLAIANLHEASIDGDTISVKYADDREKQKEQNKRVVKPRREPLDKPKVYQKVAKIPGASTGKRPRKRISKT